MPNIRREQFRQAALNDGEKVSNEIDTVKLWHICPALIKAPPESWPKWVCDLLSTKLEENGDAPVAHELCPLKRSDEQCRVPFADALSMVGPVVTTLYGIEGEQRKGRPRDVKQYMVKPLAELPPEVLLNPPEQNEIDQGMVA